MKRLGRFLMRHRTLSGLLHRIVSPGGRRCPCFVCAAVWAAMPEDTYDRLREARADYEAGRFYHWDSNTGTATPNLDWPKDGPQPTVERMK